MSQDSIIIYRDIRDTLLTLPPELCKEVMRLLFAYAFDDQEPDEDADPIAKGFFLAFKSRFDMNAARLERNQANGRKGGAPKGNQNARKKTTENGKETTQNNPKQSISISISKSILTSTNVEDKEKNRKRKKQPKKEKRKRKNSLRVERTTDTGRI